MDDRRFAGVKILETTSDVKHHMELDTGLAGLSGLRIDTYDFAKRRCVDVADVVKQIAIGTQLANDHHRGLLRVLRNANTKLENKVGMQTPEIK